MPREGVPYPERLLCSVRCELKNIWSALSGKLHSVNGVEGDGAGNVNIVSGDAAVVVTPDASLNQIEISLDQAQLPSAAVTSVNGETGAVVLDASEIGSSGSSDVQTDIDALKGADVTLQGNINAEATARQNADSALQTNINNVTASLPGAAAAAVAADPTIAQLVIDMNDKVDVSDVSTGDTPGTIAKRNGSGRLVAADPASGATDKTLVTANWISQTGSGKPNNVLHDSGNEDVGGIKNYTLAAPKHAFNGNLSSGSGWFRIMETETSVSATRRVSVINIVERDTGRYMKLLIQRRASGQESVRDLINSFEQNKVIITRDSSGKMTVWTSYIRTSVWVEFDGIANQKYESARCTPIDSDTVNPEPAAADYAYWVEI